jgi:hypothetical protein
MSSASVHFFMFCAPILIFDGTEGVRSHFHFLRSNSFSALPRALVSFFMFFGSILVYGGTVGVVSRFYVLRARTRFRRCRVHQVPFSCFALLDSFLAMSSASGPFFMFCAPGLIFGGTGGVGSRFHVLRARTRFRRYRGRRVPFPCFARPNSFSAVPRASGPVFMFCTPGLVFSGVECVGVPF